MSNSDYISKLGSAASEIEIINESYKKTHILKNKNEYYAITKGIECLTKALPDEIHSPNKISNNFSDIDSDQYKLCYEQTILSPWIESKWITGEQLFRLGQTILAQQKILIENELTFIDARPSNYWLANNKGKLVDLAGIKPLSSQNLLSFETDFKNNIINPLILEKDLNIPVSQFFKGKLESCNLNLWGIAGTLTSFKRFKDASKSSVINFLSNKLSSSSPEFIDYLNSNENNEETLINNKKVYKSVLSQINLLKSIRPNEIKESNWDNYENFHEESYTKNKLKSINEFVEKYNKFFKIVDLGSNLTTKDTEGIMLRVDNDMSVCRQMRQFFDDEKIILQLNIAECLCFENTDENNVLNLFGHAKASIMTSIIHHLLIDYGLPFNIFYKNLSKLYSKVLLEFPSHQDPMVKLLMRKKNEIIHWDWDQFHKSECLKYFNIESQTCLSETRFMVELTNKEID